MNRNEFGIEGITEEDRAYNGSRFSDVCDAIFANPYQKIWGGEGEPPLPFVGPTLSSLLRRTLPLGQPYFGQAAKRTVDSHADLRWGPDGKGFRRLIHPNGVCLTGLWEITEPTEYTGYFRKDSHALVVGRYSTGANTKRGKLRAQALAGKLFPTTDPSHPKPFRTANFFAMEDIAGENTRLHQRCRASQRSQRYAMAQRQGRTIFSFGSCRRCIYSCRQDGFYAPTLPHRRTRQTARRTHARASIHAPPRLF
jgi:hypothetical protein